MRADQPPARGSRKGRCGLVRTVVSFDAETFDQIRQRAVREKQPVTRIVRELVEWGLEA